VSEIPKKMEEKSPPMTLSTSILMKTPKVINNRGQSMWWEDVELWVVSKGRKPYPPPPSHQL